MSKKKSIVKIKGASKVYYLGEEEVRAVWKVNLEIESGEYVGILGTSGCGKSTLMYLIGLLENPSSGSVNIDGKDTSKLNDFEQSKLRNEYIGFVFQQFNLINKFTVLENVLLPVRYAKESLKNNRKDYEERAEDLLNKFGIWERRNFFPNKISGGQQQRAAIARALIMQPRIILADEPTGNVDTKTGEEILDILDLLNTDFGATVIVVTHDHQVAERTRKQIYMRDGEIVEKYLW